MAPESASPLNDRRLGQLHPLCAASTPVSKRPDAAALVEQLLLSYRATRKHHVVRRKSIGAGARAMLKSAGLSSDRAKAIDVMAKRVADAWRKSKHHPGPAELDSEIERLLT